MLKNCSQGRNIEGVFPRGPNLEYKSQEQARGLPFTEHPGVPTEHPGVPVHLQGQGPQQVSGLLTPGTPRWHPGHDVTAADPDHKQTSNLQSTGE